jgi:hypothetical protein
MANNGHKCHRCNLVDPKTSPVETSKLDTVDGTLTEDGDTIFFASGYSAREIALKRARETNASVYVNNLSRNIRRPDLTVPVAYAVARSPVFTLRAPDEWHGSVYKAYWPPLNA